MIRLDTVIVKKEYSQPLEEDSEGARAHSITVRAGRRPPGRTHELESGIVAVLWRQPAPRVASRNPVMHGRRFATYP
jgi:hypothetical protein